MVLSQVKYFFQFKDEDALIVYISQSDFSFILFWKYDFPYFCINGNFGGDAACISFHLKIAQDPIFTL